MNKLNTTAQTNLVVRKDQIIKVRASVKAGILKTGW